MLLSVVVPAHNEEECIEKVLLDLVRALDDAGIPHEIVAVDDNSTDRTGEILDELPPRASRRSARCIAPASLALAGHSCRPEPPCAATAAPSSWAMARTTRQT